MAVCDEYRLASINRSPRQPTVQRKIYGGVEISTNDFVEPGMNGSGIMKMANRNRNFLDKLMAVREIFNQRSQSGIQGRTGAIWACSDRTIPIPGFKTVKQIEENCAAMQFGPLTPQQ